MIRSSTTTEEFSPFLDSLSLISSFLIGILLWEKRLFPIAEKFAVEDSFFCREGMHVGGMVRRAVDI